MNYTNNLDRLPVELHMYIADILESDRRFELKQRMNKAGKYLEKNFIRTNDGYEVYYTKKGNTVYYVEFDHSIYINYSDRLFYISNKEFDISTPDNYHNDFLEFIFDKELPKYLT